MVAQRVEMCDFRCEKMRAMWTLDYTCCWSPVQGFQKSSLVVWIEEMDQKIYMIKRKKARKQHLWTFWSVTKCACVNIYIYIYIKKRCVGAPSPHGGNPPGGGPLWRKKLPPGHSQYLLCLCCREKKKKRKVVGDVRDRKILITIKNK